MLNTILGKKKQFSKVKHPKTIGMETLDGGIPVKGLHANLLDARLLTFGQRFGGRGLGPPLPPPP